MESTSEEKASDSFQLLGIVLLLPSFLPHQLRVSSPTLLEIKCQILLALGRLYVKNLQDKENFLLLILTLSQAKTGIILCYKTNKKFTFPKGKKMEK